MLQARRQNEVLMSLEVRMTAIDSSGDYRHDNPRPVRAGFSRRAGRVDRVDYSLVHGGDYTPELTEPVCAPIHRVGQPRDRRLATVNILLINVRRLDCEMAEQVLSRAA
jgi:hypothetical protein